jgi:4-diphosphocytidyl-2-C-methyl-D-erythritol kinase
MIDFPNAKINLGLNILGKRNDGYHDISTCYYPIGWKDALEIIPSASNKTSISLSGLDIPGKPEENLCIKAYNLIKKDFELPNVKIHLHKLIPAGGGLGGGSSDAAFILKMADRFYNLFLDEDLLAWYASKLGSDCPFFIYNTPRLASGRGEVLEEIRIDLSGKHIAVVNPGIMVNTAEAYRSVVPRIPDIPIKEILENKPVDEWRNFLKNDFEENVFMKFPVINEIKNKLYQSGAIYASMSGSGSSVFGIFNEFNIKQIEFPGVYTVWHGIL